MRKWLLGHVLLKIVGFFNIFKMPRKYIYFFQKYHSTVALHNQKPNFSHKLFKFSYRMRGIETNINLAQK